MTQQIDRRSRQERGERHGRPALYDARPRGGARGRLRRHGAVAAAHPAPAKPFAPAARPMSQPIESTSPATTPPAAPAIRADDMAAPGLTYFEQAVEQHSRRLLSIARAIVGYRASPEDVVQQALTNLFRHRERYDWRNPGGLLKRATVNEALRLLRPPKMNALAEEAPAGDRRPSAGERHAAPEAGLETRETVRKVREAIDQLPDHFRAALVLCEYEGMSYQQISETLDCSIPQVKTWLHRARRKLAGLLEPYVDPQ